jgi:hypothetical protein
MDVRNRDRQHLSRIGIACLLASAAASGLGMGCDSPTDPPSPPSGGNTPVLSYDAFVSTVEPILIRQECDAAGDCHGGGIRGSFELSPPDAKDVRFDFDQTVLQVSAGRAESSPVLTEPLAEAAGGTPHAVKPFASTDDPDYQAILAWIVEGERR